MRLEGMDELLAEIRHLREEVAGLRAEMAASRHVATIAGPVHFDVANITDTPGVKRIMGNLKEKAARKFGGTADDVDQPGMPRNQRRGFLRFDDGRP